MPALLPIGLLLLAAGASAQRSGMSVEDFAVADQAAKTSVLTAIASARMDIAIDHAIVLVRAGLHDSETDVRMAALVAVMGRAMAAHSAGTSGPWMGPSPASV